MHHSQQSLHVFGAEIHVSSALTKVSIYYKCRIWLLLLIVIILVIDVCSSASSDLSISVSSQLEDEDVQQLQQTMKQTLARFTRFDTSYLSHLTYLILHQCEFTVGR